MKKYGKIAATVVGVALIKTALVAQTTYTWIGGTGNWNVGENWTPAGPPPINCGNIVIGGVNSVVTIPVGYTARVGLEPAQNPPYNMIYGPEWGAQLHIYGTLIYDWHMAPVQWNPAARSFIGMYGNSYLSGEGICLGASWWWNDGPYVTMSMHDNALAEINWMFWGGHLYLHDNAIMKINYGLTVDTVGAVSDATRLIDIRSETAQLNLPGGFTPTVENWVSRGILKAFGGGGKIIVSEELNPGRTTVMALVPEPTTLALIGSGCLTVRWMLRRRTK
ncbi:MAG: PEP-CTERM sorting domain-containing protein [Verrucomicrobiae bacterium]|nr:PEP-CTERM sorting domain-containing protein [Verrucomicrobiae bacterium]MCX7722313.1 PEP-CTERM sorting domain-containing protein [Verrucomicrobiae bacterium]MDW7979776.1 PEP-CTERM sorting domain-containing protein [Verrucomicrobiales bacterium]